MGGYLSSSLAYADNITLQMGCISDLRTLSKVCDQYATEFDLMAIQSLVLFPWVKNVYLLI